ncbi:hypothetical protein KD27_00650 [Smithella sp. D17]|jgi:hypothetical protein|nr:hypothetical protein KD27_00650 [Smithella sp. D17]
MENIKLTIGFSPHLTKKRHLRGLTAFRQHIYDLHFPHYNPQISSSGRAGNQKVSLDEARKRTMRLISWNQEHTGFKLTLLLNYLLHDNYKVVIDNVLKEFYPRGVRSFVVADLELIKRLKDALPDCEIQGSCLSHRMTEKELEEERREGVVLHNPSVNIIRNPAQLERNHKAGFAQKVIAFEGCHHNCPDESAPHGHRWFLARSLSKDQYLCKNPDVSLDPRFFFKANWVTVSRLKTLLPFISVVKLPRGRDTILSVTKKFMHVLNTNASYNIVDFITAGYGDIIDQNIGEIPSHLFDDNFFSTVENCAMNCDERQCRLCFDMMDKIKEVNGGPKQPDIFMKSYRRLRHLIRTTLDGAE